jgi:hypothetical protein
MSDQGQEGEHHDKLELLLNCKELHWVTHKLVQLCCHTSAADEWLPADTLLNCQEKVAEYDASVLQRRSRASRGGTSAAAATSVVASNPALKINKKPGTDVFYHQGSGTASQATPRGRHRIRAGVGFELAI